MNKYFLNSLFYAIVASFGGFLFGYHTASIAGALNFISNTFHISVTNQGFLVSIILLGAFIGSFLGGTIADSIGRKNAFFISIYILFFGTFSFVTYKNIYLLFLSRATVGFSIGIFSAVVPIYIAEISKPEYRGKLVSLNQLFLVIGIFTSNIVSFFFSKNENWEAMFLFGLVFALLMFIFLFFIPESPSFLANKNRQKEAEVVLNKITDEKKNSEVIKKIQSSKKISFDIFFTKEVKRALFIGIGINIFRQITGINLITYYAPKIFSLSGFNLPHLAMLATIAVTSVNLIATIVTVSLIDKIGRRPLLITGICGMMISMIFLGIIFITNPFNLPMLVIICLMLFNTSFAIGLGSNSWLINSEIFPMEIRGKAVGITTLFNWISNYLVASSFLILIYHFGMSQTFFLFAFISIIALLFAIKKVPETKGKSFLEIQKFFQKN